MVQENVKRKKGGIKNIMIFKCNRCKKKFNKKPSKIPHVARKSYCSGCYEVLVWQSRKNRLLEMREKRKLLKSKTP